MNFEEKHQDQLSGILHGFDRLIFRGYIRSFFSPKGMYYYLSQKNIKLVGYKNFVGNQTSVLKKHVEQLANQSNLKIHYINNSKTSKDEIAKKYLEDHPTKQGLIAIISCLEIAPTFVVRGNYLKKELEIRKELGQHLQYYFYYMDAEFGWMHVKLQTYYPFTIQVYVNGREYLKKALDNSGIAYESYKNSITWVEDLAKAQQLADQLIQKKWDRFLNVFAKGLNPHYQEIQKIFQGKGYHWCLHQSEYATDVLFKERSYLENLYSGLVQQATLFNGGEDIYSFFGKRLHGNCTKEVTGSKKRFMQGFRVKHYLDRNSIKMYDKQSILRIETTINNPKAFKIFKTCQQKGKTTKAWRPMGKAVSNLYRYAQIARSANIKYLERLAQHTPRKDLSRQIEKISQKTSTRTRNNKQRVHTALNLLSKETSLILEAINDGRFTIQAFSNKQLRKLLIEKGVFYLDTSDPVASKRLSGKITRLLSKLRGHRLIRKISHSSKYQLTNLGQQICLVILRFKKLELQVL